VTTASVAEGSFPEEVVTSAVLADLQALPTLAAWAPQIAGASERQWVRIDMRAGRSLLFERPSPEPEWLWTTLAALQAISRLPEN